MAQATRNKAKPVVSAQLVRGVREGVLLVVLAVVTFIFIALISYQPEDPAWSHSGLNDEVANAAGWVGAWFADVSYYFFGGFAYLFPLTLLYGGGYFYKNRGDAKPVADLTLVFRASGFLLLIFAGTALAGMHFSHIAAELPVGIGGMLGEWLAAVLIKPFSIVGATVLLFALFLAGITLFTGLSWFWLMEAIGEWVLKTYEQILDGKDRLRDYLADRKVIAEQEKATQVITQKRDQPERKTQPILKKIKLSRRAEQDKQQDLFSDFRDDTLPSLSLLDKPSEHKKGQSQDELQAISRLVELKLLDFNIEVAVIAVHPGPVITRFELQPAAGVKVSQITNLAKDLARALAVISVRVVEVIPGKSYIGLEIPNEHREIVRLSEIISSRVFSKVDSPLTLALGKDISGHPVAVDLMKMPHLLVAGTTGSGKSVALNSMVLSLLYNARPDQVRTIMIDPKMLELSIYEGIPHLLTPVVTDMKEAAHALRWCVAEMDNRYRLLAAMGTRSIAGYNRKVNDAIKSGEPIVNPVTPTDNENGETIYLDPLPYIVVIVDELADMMMVVGKKVEELIARLAQKARAAGIHLILATQRPSVDVLTGLIKANIPTRIAFQVSSRIDSRTVLDQMGAEQLLGHGDMLYLPPGTAVPTRVHGAFVDDHEVHNVVNELRKSSEPNYIEGLMDGSFDAASGDVMLNGGEEVDELYDQAVRIVTESRRASISGIQRRLKIGYNRSARMVEEMERSGVVGTVQSNGSREVLAPPPPEK